MFSWKKKTNITLDVHRQAINDNGTAINTLFERVAELQLELEQANKKLEDSLKEVERYLKGKRKK